MILICDLRIEPNVAAADCDYRSAPHRNRARLACCYAHSLSGILCSDRDGSPAVVLDTHAVGDTATGRADQKCYEWGPKSPSPRSMCDGVLHCVQRKSSATAVQSPWSTERPTGKLTASSAVGCSGLLGAFNSILSLAPSYTRRQLPPRLLLACLDALESQVQQLSSWHHITVGPQLRTRQMYLPQHARSQPNPHSPCRPAATPQQCRLQSLLDASPHQARVTQSKRHITTQLPVILNAQRQGEPPPVRRR